MLVEEKEHPDHNNHAIDSEISLPHSVDQMCTMILNKVVENQSGQLETERCAVFLACVLGGSWVMLPACCFVRYLRYLCLAPIEIVIKSN